MVSTTRRNTSQRLTLLILVLLSVTAITLDYRGEASHGISHLRNVVTDVFSPIQRALSDVFHPIGNVFAGAFNYGSATSENARLRQEIGALRLQVLENQTAEQQLEAILNEEHLPYVQNLPPILCEVIGGSTSNFLYTFEIDRGTSSGIGVGMPVVAGPGLVGVIATAGSSTSTVQTIEDPGSSFGVRLGTSGSIAVANGRGRGYPLSLSGITAGVPVHVGETIYTSGVYGASLPAGIPVGTVTSVNAPAGGLTKTVLMTPVTNLNNIGVVTVLQWFPAP